MKVTPNGKSLVKMKLITCPRNLMPKVKALLFLLLVCGCGERDLNYEALKSTPREEQIEKLMTYPLEERFRLYNKVHRNSGHPKDVGLAFGFLDKPEESFAYIINDLENNSTASDYYRYDAILTLIDGQTNFDICRPDRFDRLREVVAGYYIRPEILDIIRRGYLSKCGHL